MVTSHPLQGLGADEIEMQQIKTNLTSPSGAWGGLKGMLRRSMCCPKPLKGMLRRSIFNKKREKMMKSKCSKSILTSHPLQGLGAD